MGVGGEGKKRPYERGKHLKQIKKKKKAKPPTPQKTNPNSKFFISTENIQSEYFGIFTKSSTSSKTGLAEITGYCEAVRLRRSDFSRPMLKEACLISENRLFTHGTF